MKRKRFISVRTQREDLSTNALFYEKRTKTRRRRRNFVFFKVNLSTLGLVSLVMCFITMTIFFIDGDDRKEPCALLFFGLVKDDFKSLTLPSVKQSILDINSHCDVFLHTYNLTEAPINPRNLETIPVIMDVSQALSLTSEKDHILFESLSSFHSHRDDILNHTKIHYHRRWGECCISHENMIKQWHSIHQVWNLMKKHERQILLNLMKESENTIDLPSHLHYYKQVGLFRSDVYYPSPINIFDSVAAIPNFSHYFGYNDRFFYGNYTYAEIWASKRFDFVPIFESEYMLRYNRKVKEKDGYHSETYLKRLLDHYKVPVEKKDICVLRVRSGSRIKVDDCIELDQFNTSNKTMQHISLPRTDYDIVLTQKLNWKNKTLLHHQSSSED